MDESTRYALLAPSAALLVPGVAALWKAASLRGDLFEKWDPRVDVALAGLNEQAVNQLLLLQQRINELLLVNTGSGFEPLRVVADPSELSEQVRKFQRIIDVRDRLRRRFAAILKLGTAQVWSVSSYLLGVTGATAYFARFTRVFLVGLIGSALALLGLTGMITVTVAYIYYQHKLSAAEILSAEGHGDE